jgi:hypothetical protein
MWFVNYPHVATWILKTRLAEQERSGELTKSWKTKKTL